MQKTLISFVLAAGMLLASCGTAATPNSNVSITGSGVDLSGAAPTENFQGSASSSVVLVEFSDLQCPACKNAEPSVKSILDEFGDRIKFEYRHFPLAMHRNAKDAAYAAEAAAMQGKFWEMKDKLFQQQSVWSESPEAMQLFVTYAQELGLDTAQFERDARSDAVKAIVERDLALGNEIGVNSTPSFFLNGKRLRPSSFAEFSALVREAVLNQ